MAKKTKVTKKQITDYIAFLEKALKSDRFRTNEPVKYEQYKVKLKNEKLKLKLLFNEE